ncbi:MAG: AMP-binding protein, partial [bacterium]|nr:AMP-binding protein [bacterium]
YLNRPELTAKRFVKTSGHLAGSSKHTAHKASLYKTGDVARWLPDGNIEFLGRIDHQVKIRGFRIELEEIQKRLLNHPQINEAVVLARQSIDEDNFLCAYYAAPGPQQPEPGLKDFLSRFLPGYMIPSFFIKLERIPLTPNGKIDRKALSQLQIPKLQSQTYTAPRNEIEKKMTGIWSDILEIPTEEIGIDNDFFQIGGHSLKATTLVSKIHKEFNVKLPLAEIFNTSTIRKLAAYLKEAQEEKYISIEPVEKKEYYPLSYNQKRLFFIHRVNPENTSYNMPGEFIISYEADVPAIQKTLAAISRKHESFRTFYRTINGEPIQFIKEKIEIPLKISDLSSLPEEEKQQERNTLFQKQITTPFNLSEPPLFRVLLIKLQKEHWEFVFNMHHIITDGWSMDILKRDFSFYYDAFGAGQNIAAEPSKLHYKDFAAWSLKQIAHPQIKKEAHSFWMKKLKKETPDFNIIYDYSGGRDNYSGAQYRRVTGTEIKESLGQMARESSTTLFNVMFAAFNWLIYRLTGSTSIPCSIINAGRQQDELQEIVGFFVNSIAANTTINTAEDINEFIRRLTLEVSELFQYQTYPIELVLEELKKPYREAAVSFNMLNQQHNTAAMQQENLRPRHDDNAGEVKSDLELYVTEYKNTLETLWVYKKTRFKPGTVENIARGYLELLEIITTHRSEKKEPLKIKNLKLAAEPGGTVTGNTIRPHNDYTPFEKAEIEQTATARFQQQVLKQGDKVAIKSGDLHLTYDMLNRCANRTAHAERAKKQHTMQPAALLFGHGINMIVGIFGTLKTGKIYVPLDPEYPRERLLYILKDSQARTIVTDTNNYDLAAQLRDQVNKNISIINISRYLTSTLTGEKARISEENPEEKSAPSQPAYVLYTSGSTGRPKGVIQNHRNLLHFARLYTNALHLNTEDRLSLFSSYGFDAAKMDIFGALLNGGTLYPYEIKKGNNLTNLGRWLREERITVYHSIPTVYRYFTDMLTGRKTFDSLRAVVLGG